MCFGSNSQLATVIQNTVQVLPYQLVVRWHNFCTTVITDFSHGDRFTICEPVSRRIYYKWNFYSKNNFKIQTCLFTKHESLQGDSPRVHPNILKCSLHSLVTKGIRLVGFATRAMLWESPTHYLIVSKFISDPWGGGRDLWINRFVFWNYF